MFVKDIIFIRTCLAPSFDVIELSLVSSPKIRVCKSHRILPFGDFSEVIHVELSEQMLT
jgi:hypothetical protein